jgi:hypothetical protein
MYPTDAICYALQLMEKLLSKNYYSGLALVLMNCQAEGALSHLVEYLNYFNLNYLQPVPQAM